MSERRSQFRVSGGSKLSFASGSEEPPADSQFISLKLAKAAGQDTAPHQRLNILLAGLSGTGKSSTANRIFGAALCPVATGTSVTTTPNICQTEVKRDGLDFTLTIVDAPGLKDTRGPKQDVENLAHTKALLQHPEYKPDIVLMAFDATNTRLSGDAIREPILSLKLAFETLINWRMVVVLFTRADSYASDIPFTDHMAAVTAAVQAVIFEATGVSDVPCIAVENGPGVPWDEIVKAQGVDWIHELTINTMPPMLRGLHSLKPHIFSLMLAHGPSLLPNRMPEEDVQRLLDPVQVDNFRTEVSVALESVQRELQEKTSELAVWLQEHGLGQYAAAFKQAGYDDVTDVVADFTEDSLIEKLNMLAGHAAKMARELELRVP